MGELKKIEEYLVSKDFFIDYECENQRVWTSPDRAETIISNIETCEFVIEEPFDTSRIVRTLEEIKYDLE